MAKPSPLKLINGDKERSYRLGGIELIPVIENTVPAHVSTTIVEEDTWLVLSAKLVIREQENHPIRIMTDLVEQQACTPGDILPRGHTWLAIIYDLDQEPVCQKEWIEQATNNIIDITGERKIQTISLPLLGSTHGRLTGDDSLETMLQVISEHAQDSRLKIWLRTEKDQLITIRKLLEAYIS